MAGNGLNMKDINEIKRLHKLGLSLRQIARTLSIHRNTITKYIEQTAEQGAPTHEGMQNASPDPTWSGEIDWEKIRSEYLQGVPLTVLHEELFKDGKVPVQYPGFWKQASKKIDLTEATMVRLFRPAERIEIDYADGIAILDPVTGGVRKTQLFVGVLCHSRYTFAEFTWSQTSADFLQSHVNMFSFFGGTAEVLSPDNLKSAVTKAHRYDPTINQAYTRLAEYYDIAVVPARVKRPQDKAIVERTIQIFQRWFYMLIRARTFTSLIELNQCLREHLVVFNNRRHRVFKRTRAAMFEEERVHLKGLPETPYRVATYHRAKLSRDCHLIFDANFYSAPHWLRGKELDIWAAASQIEVYHEAERVAVHVRNRGHGKFITDTKHYPPAQQVFAEQDVQGLLLQARQIGPETEQLIKSLLHQSHPLRQMRRIQGILSLSRRYSRELLEEAVGEANRFNNRHMQFIERVIKMRKGVKRDQDIGITTRAENPHLRGTNNIH